MDEQNLKSGFVAGTMVHTHKGLVPIQDIKVGDRVLSSPEQGDGSVREYKCVVHTFKAEAEEIYELIIRRTVNPDLEYVEDDILRNIYEILYLIGGHPVFVGSSVFVEGWDDEKDIDQINARNGTWQAARDLKLYDQIVVSNPKHGDGSGYEVVSIAPVQDVNRDYGFVSAVSDDDKLFDTVVYFNEHDYQIIGGDINEGRTIKRHSFIGPYRHVDYPNDYPLYKDFQENYEKITAKVNGYLSDIPTLRRPIYNFEVEDFHTYFVGEQGLWIHDQST